MVSQIVSFFLVLSFVVTALIASEQSNFIVCTMNCFDQSKRLTIYHDQSCSLYPTIPLEDPPTVALIRSLVREQIGWIGLGQIVHDIGHVAWLSHVAMNGVIARLRHTDRSIASHTSFFHFASSYTSKKHLLLPTTSRELVACRVGAAFRKV
jgi:hypothetical protein